MNPIEKWWVRENIYPAYYIIYIEKAKNPFVFVHDMDYIDAGLPCTISYNNYACKYILAVQMGII